MEDLSSSNYQYMDHPQSHLYNVSEILCKGVLFLSNSKYLSYISWNTRLPSCCICNKVNGEDNVNKGSSNRSYP